MPSFIGKPALLAALLVCGTALLDAAPADPGPESVVVVANRAMDGSLTVARAYMDRRDIPESNLIILETETSEKITRGVFLETIRNPILETLLERDLVNAFEGERDRFGRLQVTVFENPIQYLVLCYGIPSRIAEAPEETPIDDLRLRENLFKGDEANLVEQFSTGRMARNEASVDGELALLLKRDMPLNGFVLNPFYKNRLPGGVQDILKVTRLDGPSPRAVIGMLDSALKGEEKGLKGRAYVDEDGRGGGFQIGNDWFANTAKLFDAMGYGLDHDTARGTFSGDDRFDAPVLYAGWYARHVNGPFTLPGFRFPDGAIAAHLHSFSASPLRSANRGWVGPFVERGVAATFGNVAEPYLRITHQFDLFFAALVEGWNFGDAVYFAQPALSWQNVAIGDPLYKPLATSLEAQLEALGDPLTILSDQYVVIRQIRQLEKAGRIEDALKAAARGMREAPGPALALERSRLLEQEGKPEAAVNALSFLSGLAPGEPMQYGLYAEIADTLHRLGADEEALTIYRSLADAKMPEPVRLAFLKRGIPVAEDAGKPDIALEWRMLTRPPEPEKPESAPGSESPQSQGN